MYYEVDYMYDLPDMTWYEKYFYEWQLKIVFYLFLFLSYLYSFVMCYNYKYMKVAINVLKVSMDFISKNPKILVVPLIFNIIFGMFFLAWMRTGGLVFSMGNIYHFDG